MPSSLRGVAEAIQSDLDCFGYASQRRDMVLQQAAQKHMNKSTQVQHFSSQGIDAFMVMLKILGHKKLSLSQAWDVHSDADETTAGHITDAMIHVTEALAEKGWALSDVADIIDALSQQGADLDTIEALFYIIHQQKISLPDAISVVKVMEYTQTVAQLDITPQEAMQLIARLPRDTAQALALEPIGELNPVSQAKLQTLIEEDVLLPQPRWFSKLKLSKLKQSHHAILGAARARQLNRLAQVRELEAAEQAPLVWEPTPNPKAQALTAGAQLLVGMAAGARGMISRPNTATSALIRSTSVSRPHGYMGRHLLASSSYSVKPVSFASQVTYSAGTAPRGITTADFNRDGKADLAVANWGSNTVSVLLNKGDGSGTFLGQVPYALGSGPSSVTTADVNGDSHADLAAASENGNIVSVLLNKGDGTGVLLGQKPYAAGSNPFGITTADFNGDGHADLAGTNWSSGTVFVLLNNGTGAFLGQKTYLVVGSNTFGITTADFNGDGKADLAVPNKFNNTVSVLLNKGDGTGAFLGQVSYAAGGLPVGITTADFNRDGHADLAAVSENGNIVSVLLNKGDGTGAFLGAVTYAVGRFPYDITAADFNGDGHADLAATNRNDNTVAVLLNKGDGTGALLGQKPYATGSNPFGITTADFNGDGRPDLAVANYGSNTVSVLLNQIPNYKTASVPKSHSHPKSKSSKHTSSQSHSHSHSHSLTAKKSKTKSHSHTHSIQKSKSKSPTHIKSKSLTHLKSKSLTHAKSKSLTHLKTKSLTNIKSKSLTHVKSKSHTHLKSKSLTPHTRSESLSCHTGSDSHHTHSESLSHHTGTDSHHTYSKSLRDHTLTDSHRTQSRSRSHHTGSDSHHTHSESPSHHTHSNSHHTHTHSPTHHTNSDIHTHTKETNSLSPPKHYTQAQHLSIAQLSDDRTLRTYTLFNQDNTNLGIQAEICAPAGTPCTLIQSLTASLESSCPAPGCEPDYGSIQGRPTDTSGSVQFDMTWVSQHHFILLGRFEVQGNSTEPILLTVVDKNPCVSICTPALSPKLTPTLTIAPDGSELIAWVSVAPDRSGASLVAQAYLPPTGLVRDSRDNIPVSDMPGFHLSPSSTTLSNQTPLVIWTWAGNLSDIQTYQVLGQFFSNGEKQGAAFLINTQPGTYLDSTQAVTATQGGGFVAAMVRNKRVIARFFIDNNATAAGSEVPIDDSLLDQGEISVSARPAGGFIFNWRRNDSSTYQVEFSANRTALSAPSLIRTSQHGITHAHPLPLGLKNGKVLSLALAHNKKSNSTDVVADTIALRRRAGVHYLYQSSKAKAAISTPTGTSPIPEQRLRLK